jgi:hypothetical protein
MAKPILLFKLKGLPTEEDKNYIHAKINKEIGDDYYKLLIFGEFKETSIELLTKGRNTKTLTKQLKKLIDLNNGK